MSKNPRTLQQAHSRQRDLRLVTSMVILVLAAGFLLLWPSVEDAAIARFGESFPSNVLQAELIFLVSFLILYLWMKGRQIDHLYRDLSQEKGVSRDLKDRLAQARAVLETSAGVHVEQDSGEALQTILKCVTESLRGDRGAFYRLSPDGSSLEREAVFPSSSQAPHPGILAFEDQMARLVMAGGGTLILDSAVDPTEYGIQTSWEPSFRTLAICPMIVDDRAAGALLIRNVADCAADVPEESQELLEIFASFAAGVIRNLRVFREVADRNAQLDRAHRSFTRHQRELVEIETVTSMATIANTLAHALSSPMTSIHGYSEILCSQPDDPRSLRRSREGLHREIVNLRDRLQNLIDFISHYRAKYELCDLCAVLESAAQLRIQRLGRSNLDLQLKTYKDLPLTVVDSVRIRQVFLSVFDFIEESVRNEKQRLPVHARILPYSGQIRVQFCFHGREGALELIKRLLNPNVELGAVHREHGMTLAIASNIVRHHLGDISVEMFDDQRLLITIDLPIRRDIPTQPKKLFPIQVDESASGLSSMEQAIVDIFGPDEDSPVPPGDVPTREALEEADEEYKGSSDEPAAAFEPDPPAVERREDARREVERPRPAATRRPAEPTAPADEPRELLPLSEPAPSGPDGAGLDEIFGPGQLWSGDSTTPVKPPPPRTRRETAPLLDPSEVDNALKLFDE